jgi:ABC-2 type transport system ATP-binding protein
MTDTAIRVRELWKTYDGRAVLDRMSFDVPRGSICGLVGPNGAGKTTTLRVLMGFAFAEAGSTAVLDVDGPMTPALLQRVAFVPEAKDLYPFARAGEMIRLTRGFYPKWDRALEAALVGELEIPLRTWCTKLSKGTLARLWLLLALCRGAELLILDEPTDGLDPIALDRIQRLLVRQVADRGLTVLFSTHQLGEVEQIADHLVMVHRGHCVVEGSLDDIRQRYRVVRCVLDDERAVVPSALEGWRRDGRFLTGLSGDDPAEMAERLGSSGVQVLDAQPASLKDVFLDHVGR